MLIGMLLLWWLESEQVPVWVTELLFVSVVVILIHTRRGYTLHFLCGALQQVLVIKTWAAWVSKRCLAVALHCNYVVSWDLGFIKDVAILHACRWCSDIMLQQMIVCQNITCTISLSRPKWMFLSHACWRFEIFDTHRDWIIHRFRQHRSILLSCTCLFCYLCVLTIGSWCAENRLLYLSPWNLLRVSCQYPFKALMIFRYLFVYWAKLWLLHYHLWCLATFLTPDIGHFSRQILCMLCHHLRHILHLIVALRFAPNRLHSISVCYCLPAILDLSVGQGWLWRRSVRREITLVSHSLEDTCQVWFVWKWLGRSCVLWQMMLCDALCLESLDRIVQHPTLSQMLQHTWIEIVDLLLNVCIVCLIVNGLWMMSKLRSLHQSWVAILQGLLTTAVDEHIITVWWDARISWELRVIPRLIYGL